MSSLVDRLNASPDSSALSQSKAVSDRIQEDRQDRDAVILLIDQIEVEEQARKDLGDLNPLAKSIKDHGQMHAVVVIPTDNPHRFKLRKGARRYFSIRDILHGDTIRATIDRSGAQQDRVKTRLGQLHENIQRKDYEPFELANEFQSLIDETKWTLEQLAAEIGVTKGWVSKKLSLLKAPPEIQAAIKSGEMAETDYYNNKEQKQTEVATKRAKPGDGEGGAAGDTPKLPKKFSMSWEDAAVFGSLLVGFLRKEHPGSYGHLTITNNASPEEVAAFFGEVKEIWGKK